ncbi:hypothetical protein EVAR_91244_1 [Eumeta japonica]|uniref:Uncharacterized protein n=1 Tax=Eumeta variegata TaxID=151549 RepID=A0A4C1ZXU8_EUMVA|nr:hypothetical protein EVAR_91244_1 [Eumeta japonica]
MPFAVTAFEAMLLPRRANKRFASKTVYTCFHNTAALAPSPQTIVIIHRDGCSMKSLAMLICWSWMSFAQRRRSLMAPTVLGRLGAPKVLAPTYEAKKMWEGVFQQWNK